MSDPLEDLIQRAAEEAAAKAELDAVRDIGEGEEVVDREAAIEALRAEPEDDQPAWRQAS